MLRRFWTLAKESFNEWSEDKASRLAASLAYYTMLSIAPLLIISIKIVGLIFGDDAARGSVGHYFTQTVGAKGAQAAEEIIKHAGQNGAGTVATIISTVILLFSASGVFGELQDALNTVWEVKPKPNRSWWDVIRQRFFSFGLVLGVVFLLLVSLIINTILSALTSALGGQQMIWQIVNFVVSMGIIVCSFALIFRYLPDAEVRWQYVWIGAIVTGVLFTIGKFFLAWYLARASTTSVYGAAGSLVALLIWVYYSGQILFFGAEFTQTYAKLHGVGVRPDDNAVKVTENERRKQGIPHQETRAVAANVAGAQQQGFQSRPADRTTDSPRSQGWLLATFGLAAGALLSGLTVHAIDRDPVRFRRREVEQERLRKRIERVRTEVKAIGGLGSLTKARNASTRIDDVERRINQLIGSLAANSTSPRLWSHFVHGWRAGRAKSI